MDRTCQEVVDNQSFVSYDEYYFIIPMIGFFIPLTPLLDEK
jgi:hypothetical protein